MKVIIAGSRTIYTITPVYSAIEESGFTITEVVSGGAPGVDRIGEIWARAHGNIPVKVFHADWSQGPNAGPLRNARMAAYADALIAVWTGHSPGTRNMISLMQAAGKPIHLLNLERSSTGEGPYQRRVYKS